MTDLNAVNGGSPAGSTPAGLDSGMTSMSPETLLAYCQMQLGDLDTQISDQMTTQKTALREREAVESVQTVLQQFGTAGPTTVTQMQTCLDAVDSALARIAPGDQAATELTAFRQTMVTDYNYQPAGDPSQAEQTEIARDQAIVSAGPLSGTFSLTEYQNAQTDLTRLQTITTGTFTPPDASKNQWQGTTDALGTITNDIKSNADIELLQLQDLVSQRQQAVQLVSGMMGKEDQTLEDQAKAIGQ